MANDSAETRDFASNEQVHPRHWILAGAGLVAFVFLAAVLPLFQPSYESFSDSSLRQRVIGKWQSRTTDGARVEWNFKPNGQAELTYGVDMSLAFTWSINNGVLKVTCLGGKGLIGSVVFAGLVDLEESLELSFSAGSRMILRGMRKFVICEAPWERLGATSP
jgi:hypothetical protein